MLKFIDGSNGWKFIDISGDDLDEAILYLGEFPAKTSLYLNAMTCKAGVLERIATHKNARLIRSIHLMNKWNDATWLENLPWLEKLSFGYDSSHFNFSGMTKLQELGGVWSRYWKGLEVCVNLRNFSVSKYSGKVSSIPQIAHLTKIVLIQPTLQTLDGIEAAVSLEYFEIVRASKLVDIDSISSRKAKLVSLTFDKCKKIESFKSVHGLAHLKQLIIAECGHIESIAFIRSMHELEVLSIFETRLLDNDLSPCVGHPTLRELRCDDQKAYVPRVAEVKMQFSSHSNG